MGAGNRNRTGLKALTIKKAAYAANQAPTEMQSEKKEVCPKTRIASKKEKNKRMEYS